MDRRAAIGFLIKSLGVTATLPTLITTLSGCSDTTAAATDKLTFLSKEHYSLVKDIADVILPKTDIVGAADLNIAAFIDVMLAQAVDSDLQHAFNQGATLFNGQLDKRLVKAPQQSNRVLYQRLVAEHFDISAEQQQAVFALQNRAIANIASEQLHHYYLYNFLLTTRELCLLGFYTSEYIGEQVFNYDPVPGEYQACIDIEDVGNSWSS